jgi:hypothetical protein
MNNMLNTFIVAKTGATEVVVATSGCVVVVTSGCVVVTGWVPVPGVPVVVCVVVDDS